MSKAKRCGMKYKYVPNARADMHLRKKLYQRGYEIAVRNTAEIKQQKDKRQLESQK